MTVAAAFVLAFLCICYWAGSLATYLDLRWHARHGMFDTNASWASLPQARANLISGSIYMATTWLLFMGLVGIERV